MSLRREWRDICEEMTWVRRTAPWWAFVGLVCWYSVCALVVVALVAGAAVGACALLVGCTGHGRAKVGLSFFDLPVATVIEVEHADAETVRAGARVSGSPGVSLGLLAGSEGPGGGG